MLASAAKPGALSVALFTTGKLETTCFHFDGFPMFLILLLDARENQPESKSKS